jgi:hypothetical protein
MEKVIAMIAIPVSMMILECLPGRGFLQKIRPYPEKF